VHLGLGLEDWLVAPVLYQVWDNWLCCRRNIRRDLRT